MCSNHTRRHALLGTLFGQGLVGLRALATGLPAAFLSRPFSADAQEMVMCPDKTKAQYLILSTSSAGDPLNANVPGTYDAPDVVHAADPRMAATDMKLGANTVKGAKLWSTLPQWVLDRTVFFHHATLTNNHPNLPKVLRLMGGTTKQEMLPSIFARYLSTCWSTVQREPVSAGAGDLLTYEGRSLPNLPPTGLRDLLAKPDSALSRLQPLRDKGLDEMYALLKKDGTKEQLAYLDRLALSRNQARSLGDELLGLLGGITTDRAEGQATAAVALIRMNVSPVVTIRLDFGGDNHTDPDLAKAEVPQHEASIGLIAAMMEQLKTAGIEDKVTFAAYNVFGRTLKKKGLAGRDHWGSHHATVMIGKNLKAGVVGGIEPKAGDFYATPIEAATGKAAPGGGDVSFTEGLASMGKTLGAALGLPPDVMHQHVPSGKVVTGALV